MSVSIIIVNYLLYFAYYINIAPYFLMEIRQCKRQTLTLNANRAPIVSMYTSSYRFRFSHKKIICITICTGDSIQVFKTAQSPGFGFEENRDNRHFSYIKGCIVIKLCHS